MSTTSHNSTTASTSDSRKDETFSSLQTLATFLRRREEDRIRLTPGDDGAATRLWHALQGELVHGDSNTSVVNGSPVNFPKLGA
jgi:hypothetical protein